VPNGKYKEGWDKSVWTRCIIYRFDSYLEEEHFMILFPFISGTQTVKISMFWLLSPDTKHTLITIKAKGCRRHDVLLVPSALVISVEIRHWLYIWW